MYKLSFKRLKTSSVNKISFIIPILDNEKDR